MIDAVLAAATQTRVVRTIFPNDANHQETLFGGQAMAWMDAAAFICATRWCRKRVVTARSEAIDFHRAVPVGSIAELVARIVRTGQTSMLVQVEMWVEAMDRDERHLACEGTFTMVAIGGDGRPVPTDDREQRSESAPSDL